MTEEDDGTVPVLEYLIEARAVEFKLSKDRRGLFVREQCDEYFSAELTPARVDELIAELQKMRALMDETQRPIPLPEWGRPQMRGPYEALWHGTKEFFVEIYWPGGWYANIGPFYGWDSF